MHAPVGKTEGRPGWHIGYWGLALVCTLRAGMCTEYGGVSGFANIGASVHTGMSGSGMLLSLATCGRAKYALRILVLSKHGRCYTFVCNYC